MNLDRKFHFDFLFVVKNRHFWNWITLNFLNPKMDHKHQNICTNEKSTFARNSKITTIKTNSVCVKSDKVPISFQSSASFQFSKDSFLLKRLCWDEDVTFSKGFLWKTLKWSLFIDNIEIFILGAIHAHKPVEKIC